MNWKLRRRLKRLGTKAAIRYSLSLNNEDTLFFNSEHELFDYVQSYRSNNVIFSIQINRIEIYSL